MAAHVGQRSASFRFRLVNGVTGQPLGEVHPRRDTVPVLAHDTARTIKRTVNVQFNREDTAEINPLTDRVLIWMLISGVERPLGRYMFSNQARLPNTSGVPSNAALIDEMFIVDQQLESGFTSANELRTIDIATQESCDVALLRLLAGLPVTILLDQPTPYPSVGSWSAGTYRGQPVEALAVAGDYFAPWFDHDGRMHFLRAFDPAESPVDINMDVGYRVFRDSIVESDDMLQAPNRFVVISNADVDAAPAVGTYDVPTSAPHSIFNRGFVIPQVETRQLAGGQQASAVARNIGLRQTIFERVSLDTPPDPRHDSYNVVRWDGENWLELAWSMQLVEGGRMRHTMRKAYTP